MPVVTFTGSSWIVQDEDELSFQPNDKIFVIPFADPDDEVCPHQRLTSCASLIYTMLA